MRKLTDDTSVASAQPTVSSLLLFLKLFIDVLSSMSYNTHLIDFVNPKLYRAVCSASGPESNRGVKVL